MGAQVYLQLAALLFAMNHFPEGLPKRWDTVSLYVELCCKKEDSQSLDQLNMAHISVEIASDLPGGEPRKRMRKSFTGLPQECRQVATILLSNPDYADLCRSTKIFYQQLLCAPDISSSLKPLILIPPISTCYNAKFTKSSIISNSLHDIRNLHSSIILWPMQDVQYSIPS